MSDPREPGRQGPDEPAPAFPRMELPERSPPPDAVLPPPGAETDPAEEPAPAAPPELQFENRPNYLQTLHGKPSRRLRRVVIALLVGVVVGPSLLVLVPWVLRLLGLGRDEGLGKVIVFHERASGVRAEVYYTGGVTEAEARRLGQFLDQAGLFAGEKGATVQVRAQGDGLVVAFCVAEGAWDQVETVAFFRQLGRDLSRQVFDGRPVTIHLCSAQGTAGRGGAGLRGFGRDALTPKKVLD